MAWIQFDHATLTKPEVFLVAESLGVTRHHALGLLVEWFVWLDQHTVNGEAPAVTIKMVDSIVCQGFAAALVAVKWLVSHGDHVTVPNFDRHGANTAKRRSQAAERKRRQRDRERVTSRRNHADVTRDIQGIEKRREEDKEGPNAHADARDPWRDTDPHADWLTRESDFVRLWNDSTATVHLTAAALPDPIRRRLVDAWSADPNWGDKAARAIARLGAKGLWHGRRITLDWFVSPTRPDEILQGAHDDATASRKPRATTAKTIGDRPGGSVDPRFDQPVASGCPADPFG